MHTPYTCEECRYKCFGRGIKIIDGTPENVRVRIPNELHDCLEGRGQHAIVIFCSNWDDLSDCVKYHKKEDIE